MGIKLVQNLQEGDGSQGRWASCRGLMALCTCRSSSLDVWEAEKYTASGECFFLICVKYSQRVGKWRRQLGYLWDWCRIRRRKQTRWSWSGTRSWPSTCRVPHQRNARRENKEPWALLFSEKSAASHVHAFGVSSPPSPKLDWGAGATEIAFQGTALTTVPCAPGLHPPPPPFQQKT